MKVKEQKILKKISKCLSAISKDVTITVSDSPTLVILICNAGLTTGSSKEELVNLFESYGDIENVILLPGKSYSFVLYRSLQSSKDCYEQLNGSFCLENGSRPIYMSYIQSLNGK